MSTTDRRYEADQIYDLPALPPDADHTSLLEHQQREDQWRRTREPVATGSRYLKFITWEDLVNLGLISDNVVEGIEDPPLPPEDPLSPDFVNEPRMCVYARDMFLPVTYACSALTIIENDPAKPNLQVLLFDKAIYESAQFVLILPKEWPGRAVRYRVYWSHGSGATAFGVKWDMTVHSYENGESLLNNWVAGLPITDTGGTANKLYITDESAAVAVNGNLAKAHDLLLFRITRLAPDAEDTLDVDARLHAIEFNIGEVDASFPPAEVPVVLLLHFDGNFTDASPAPNTFTTHGSAVTSTTRFKFGTHSFLDNGSYYVSCPDTANFNFGSRLWSIDCWIYIPTATTLATDNTIVCSWAAGDIAWYFGVNASGFLRFFYSNDGTTGDFRTASAGPIARDTWTHVALWKSATTGTINSAINGAVWSVLGASIGTIHNSSANLVVMATADGVAIAPNGMTIDELRICVDIIQYDNTSFTPPAAPYT